MPAAVASKLGVQRTAHHVLRDDDVVTVGDPMKQTALAEADQLSPRMGVDLAGIARTDGLHWCPGKIGRYRSVPSLRHDLSLSMQIVSL